MTIRARQWLWSAAVLLVGLAASCQEEAIAGIDRPPELAVMTEISPRSGGGAELLSDECFDITMVDVIQSLLLHRPAAGTRWWLITQTAEGTVCIHLTWPEDGP